MIQYLPLIGLNWIRVSFVDSQLDIRSWLSFRGFPQFGGNDSFQMFMEDSQQINPRGILVILPALRLPVATLAYLQPPADKWPTLCIGFSFAFHGIIPPSIRGLGVIWLYRHGNINETESLRVLRDRNRIVRYRRYRYIYKSSCRMARSRLQIAPLSGSSSLPAPQLYLPLKNKKMQRSGASGTRTYNNTRAWIRTYIDGDT